MQQVDLKAMFWVDVRFNQNLKISEYLHVLGNITHVPQFDPEALLRLGSFYQRFTKCLILSYYQ